MSDEAFCGLKFLLSAATCRNIQDRPVLIRMGAFERSPDVMTVAGVCFAKPYTLPLHKSEGNQPQFAFVQSAKRRFQIVT